MSKQPSQSVLIIRTILLVFFAMAYSAVANELVLSVDGNVAVRFGSIKFASAIAEEGATVVVIMLKPADAPTLEKLTEAHVRKHLDISIGGLSGKMLVVDKIESGLIMFNVADQQAAKDWQEKLRALRR